MKGTFFPQPSRLQVAWVVMFGILELKVPMKRAICKGDLSYRLKSVELQGLSEGTILKGELCEGDVIELQVIDKFAILKDRFAIYVLCGTWFSHTLRALEGLVFDCVLSRQRL